MGQTAVSVDYQFQSTKHNGSRHSN